MPEDEDDVVVPHHEAVLVPSGFLVPVDKSGHQLNNNLVKIRERKGRALFPRKS